MIAAFLIRGCDTKGKNFSFGHQASLTLTLQVLLFPVAIFSILPFVTGWEDLGKLEKAHVWIKEPTKSNGSSNRNADSSTPGMSALLDTHQQIPAGQFPLLLLIL